MAAESDQSNRCLVAPVKRTTCGISVGTLCPRPVRLVLKRMACSRSLPVIPTLTHHVDEASVGVSTRAEFGFRSGSVSGR